MRRLTDNNLRREIADEHTDSNHESHHVLMNPRSTSISRVLTESWPSASHIRRYRESYPQSACQPLMLMRPQSISTSMPSRRTFLGCVSAVSLAGIAGCESSQTRTTPDPRDEAAFREADQSTETSTYVESQPPSEGPLLTQRGIGTTLTPPDPEDHWIFIDTPSHRDELGSAIRSEQVRALLDSVDLAEAFVFVYQVKNTVPVSLTEVVATGTFQERFCL